MSVLDLIDSLDVLDEGHDDVADLGREIDLDARRSIAALGSDE